MNLRILALVLLVACTLEVSATHNRAGEIRYEQIDDLTIRATIITYTKESSVEADRDSLILMWGDGQQSSVLRSNGDGNGESLGNDIKLNLYVAEHTYPGFGTFTLSMQDPNRNGGILNVNAPNSITVPFYIETTFTLQGSQFSGFNRSVVLLQAPIDFGCVDQIFKHDPGAFDPDGDSLAYELITPLQNSGEEVPKYEFPDDIGEGGVIQFDEELGQFIWVTPKVSGEYNIAFKVKEYRNGILIASTIRDMQIFIDLCTNQPPQITTELEYCVQAGDTLDFLVQATDPDTGQLVKLEVQGGPFFVDDPAEFFVASGFQEPVVEGRFIWETTCNHIREVPYEVIFRATDNFLDSTGLVDIVKVRIKVVGPAPQGLQAEPLEDFIELSWEHPYACQVTDGEYFRGFSIWRKLGSQVIEEDSCREGLDGQGYVKIANRVEDVLDERYIYRDVDVEAGNNYCYRVLADFALLSAAGNPFNSVSSLPGNEACAIFRQEQAVITRSSVLLTDDGAGETEIRWLLPDDMALDTSLRPGPYAIEVWRADGVTSDIADFTALPGTRVEANTFAGLQGDTSYIDTGLSTRSQAYSYAIAFYIEAGNDVYTFSKPASTPFLLIESSDRTNTLELDIDVPWSNFDYEIYRENGLTGEFELIDNVDVDRYVDDNLINDVEYCYYISTRGTYGIDGFPSPLINLSQIACGTPIDTVPPCVPSIAVANSCEDEDAAPEDFLVNRITWTIENSADCILDDLQTVRIYFASSVEGDLELIAELNGGNEFVYLHQRDQDISGCYFASSVDEVGNESALSEVVCVDNCPDYTLPNVFTPNGDGANDMFQPFPYRFVESIDMKIFNRWGQVVHETTDPDINWDGTNLSGADLADGVYYYEARIFERRVSGILENPEQLSGFIHLVR